MRNFWQNLKMRVRIVDLDSSAHVKQHHNTLITKNNRANTMW